MKASTFAAILGLTILSLSAQAKRIKTISSPEGISNNAICAIHQNALGHLYIGTMDGLNIWDGNELKTFEAKDGKNYFSGNQIRYIIPGPDCHLYLRTNYGTAKLDMITREVEFYDQLAFATSIAVTKDGNIFSISKSKALAYLNTATLEQTTYPDMHFGEAETIKQMFLLDDGRLFVATTKDTYFLTFDNSGSSPALQQVERTGIGCLFAAARSEGSHLIVSADGRVLRMDAASGTSEELSRIESALLKNDRITGAIADDSGCLLSFMQHGVMRHTYGKPGLEETDIHCGVFSMIPALKNAEQSSILQHSPEPALLTL